jgi:hypothetical protein
MAFSFPLRRRGKSLQEALDGNDAKDIRQASLNYLRTHRAWYATWSNLLTWTWNIATFSIIILGALTSILTALGSADKTLLIALPAISSLLGALLVQFRMRDVWRLRELGRIATEELICKAYLIPVDDRQAALQAAIDVRLQAQDVGVLFRADSPTARCRYRWLRRTTC